MISLAISLGDVRFLPKISYLQNLVIRHLDCGQSCRRRSGRSVTFSPRVTLVVTNGGFGNDMRILISFTSHGEREAGAV
jgi:hypothetical protein